MEIDIPGSLAAHEALLRDWERRVDEEARFIEAFAPPLTRARPASIRIPPASQRFAG